MSDKTRITFRIVKHRFSIAAMLMLFVVIAMLSGCKKSTSEDTSGTGVTNETLRFVWLADSRGDSLGDPVNTPVLSDIISKIGALKPKPSFVVFGGDMSYRGYIHNNYTFLTWKALFQPLIDSGMVLYTAIGNHELYHEHSSYGFLLVNQKEYQNVFSENPVNGPAGYDHLTYSFTSPKGNAYFAVLDPYFVDKDTIHENLGGNIDSVQLVWLKAQVAQSTATHKFLFIHTPYYYISNDTAEPSAANQSFTKLWSFLDASKFDMYACGHSHLYSRRTIDSSVLPDPQTTPATPSWQNNVVQLLNGTCGAGPSTGDIDPGVRTSWNVYNAAKTFYFSVIDINGGTVTVNSYSGNTGAYTVFDTFTMSK